MKEMDNILKIKAVLLYILQHSERDRHNVYSIVKTAYYAQQLHFVKWALPLYKDRIAALQFGPVPSTIYDILKMARGDEKVLTFYGNSPLRLVADTIGFRDEVFYVKEDADCDVLSQSNIECLDEAIAIVASMDFDEIVADTHGEEWTRVWNSKTRFMDDIMIAREGGADESVISYLQEALDLEKMLG